MYFALPYNRQDESYGGTHERCQELFPDTYPFLIVLWEVQRSFPPASQCGQFDRTLPV